MKLENLQKRISVDRLLTATVLLSDVLRTYPWLMFSSGLSIRLWAEPPLSFISALAIISSAAILFGSGFGAGLRRGGARVPAFLLSAAAVLLLTRLENGGGYSLWDSHWFGYASGKPLQLIACLGFSLFLAWRGIAISRKDLEVKYLRRNLAVGVATFAALTLIWSARVGPHAGQRLFATLAPYAFGFVFSSLIGLGMGNFLTLRKTLDIKSAAADHFARRWLLLLLGAVTGLVVAALLVTSSLSMNLALLVRPLDVLSAGITAGLVFLFLHSFGYVLVAIEWLATPVVNWIASLSGRNQSITLEGFRDFADNANIGSGGMSPDLFSALKWAVLAIVVFLAAYFLWRLLRRYWRGSEDSGYEVVHESIWSWSGIGEDLRSLLRGLGGRSPRSRVYASPPLASTITKPQPLDIREVYRGILWEGAACGHPKVHSQTAYEYGANLEKAIAGQKELIQTITHAYVQGRYGHVPASDQEALALVNRWLSLRAAMRSIQS